MSAIVAKSQLGHVSMEHFDSREAFFFRDSINLCCVHFVFECMSFRNPMLCAFCCILFQNSTSKSSL